MRAVPTPSVGFTFRAFNAAGPKRRLRKEGEAGLETEQQREQEQERQQEQEQEEEKEQEIEIEKCLGVDFAFLLVLVDLESRATVKPV